MSYVSHPELLSLPQCLHNNIFIIQSENQENDIGTIYRAYSHLNSQNCTSLLTCFLPICMYFSTISLHVHVSCVTSRKIKVLITKIFPMCMYLQAHVSLHPQLLAPTCKVSSMLLYYFLTLHKWDYVVCTRQECIFFIQQNFLEVYPSFWYINSPFVLIADQYSMAVPFCLTICSLEDIGQFLPHDYHNKPAMNTCVPVPGTQIYFISLDNMPKSTIVGPDDKSIFIIIFQ